MIWLRRYRLHRKARPWSEPLREVEGALLELDGIAHQLRITPTASIEAVETELEGCLLAFDRTHHALEVDAQASATLQEKAHAHETAAQNLAADTITRGNLIVASEVVKDRGAALH